MKPNAFLLQADARHIPLRDESVQCVVTSPPYWGLRDYGLAPLVWGGEEGCEHEWAVESLRVPCGKGGNWQQGENGPGLVGGIPRTRFRGDTNAAGQTETRIIERGFCLRCSAWRGSLGLEPTPELYVQHLVEIFREVRRVLRKDGTCWVNMGDCYATGAGSYRNPGSDVKAIEHGGKQSYTRDYARQQPNRMPLNGLKPKDLVGMPWRLAFALQADGWWLRSDIIWGKLNPMPESVRDRPTRSHEYIFLLTKSANYFFDQEAVRGWSNNSGNAEEIRFFTERQGGASEIPSIREKEGDPEEALRIGQRQGDVTSLPSDREGAGIAIEGSSQTPRSNENNQHPHGDGMERDQGELWSGLRVLQGDEQTPDPGSCNTALTGRPPYKGEYNPSLSELQQPTRKQDGHGQRHKGFNARWQADESVNRLGANIRSVWTLSTEAFSEAHFATFPQALVQPCILAGTSEKGCCATCGAPWERVVEKSGGTIGKSWHDHQSDGQIGQRMEDQDASHGRHGREPYRVEQRGWKPGCDCPTDEAVPCILLDPFCGSGTAVLVAQELGRVGIGLDLKGEYLTMARKRTRQGVLI